jgi:predicted permease
MRTILRSLRRTPAFTLTTTLLLALGIGSAALFFSAYDAVVLRTLPVSHPEQLVRIAQTQPVLGTRSSFPEVFYNVLRDHSTTMQPFGECERQFPLTSPEPAEVLRVRFVTPEFFEILGVPAMLGRALTRGDGVESTGAAPAVLSYRFWQRRFAADPRAIGRTFAIRGIALTVAGVMPPGFRGISLDSTPDVRLPLWIKPQITHTGRLNVIGDLEISARLRPGVTLERARPEALSLWRAAYLQSDPKAHDLEHDTFFRGLRVDPLTHGVSILRDKFGSALSVLTATACLLLLMVSLNLAGLMLARAASRRQDVAIRLALGASRAQILRQLLAESAVLAAIGCAAGLALANAAAPALTRALPPLRDLTATTVAFAVDLRPSATVIFCSVASAALMTLLFGLAPALTVSSTALETVLRSARSTTRFFGRNALLTFQIALSAFLLAGAGLMVQTFVRLDHTAKGFDASHVAVFTASFPYTPAKPDPAIAVHQQLIDRVRALPGVVSAAYAGAGIMRGIGMKTTFVPPGHAPSPAYFLNNNINYVSPEYFDTLGMKIVEGRNLTPDDAFSVKTANIVVNQTFVRTFFTEGRVVGREIATGMEPPFLSLHVVGVVTDAHYRSLREPMQPVTYLLAGPHDFVLYVRTAADPASIVEPARKVLYDIDPNLPFTEIDLLSGEVDSTTAAERLTAQLVSAFAAIAALIAAVGIYGLLAYVVAQRRREIGIRIAVGATPSEIGGMIGWQAARTALAGIALGLAAAWFASPLIRSLLFGVEPHDPATLALAALFLAIVTAAAVAAPAWRASRVHPVEALRCE